MRAFWTGAYSFCAANDLEMLSFESQDEHDKFLAFIKTNSSTIGQYTGNNFEFFIGAIQPNTLKTAKPATLTWYNSGQLVINTLNITWFSGEPNGAGSEFCTTIVQRLDYGGKIGANDYNCRALDLGRYTNDTIACQETIKHAKGSGSKF